MLIELFGRNFGSFRDEFHLSMLATEIDPGDDRGIVEVSLEGEDEPLRLLRCAAIYGPNASGKSTVLRAARALRRLLGGSARFESDRILGPFQPFLLDETSRGEAVMLGIRAVIDHRVYEYRIEFEQTRFVLEVLTEIAPDEERTLFRRHGQDVTGSWASHEQFKLLTRSFRPNALLLSLADSLAPSLAQGLAVGFRRLLGYRDSTKLLTSRFNAQRVARRAQEDADGFGHWMLDWLKDADVGIVDYETEEPVAHAASDDESLERVRFVHRSPGVVLSFVHGGSEGPVTLKYLSESMGTRKMVDLSPFLYELTCSDQARAFFIDEIGASIHPQLLEAIVRRFNCETRPKSVRGQLIFATHETVMLDAEAKDATLRRDQVYLTEKDSTGASRLYSIAEFKERNNLNLRRRYLHGRYGALPSLGQFGE